MSTKRPAPPPGWHYPGEPGAPTITGELRYLLFPGNPVVVRVWRGHGIEAAAFRSGDGYQVKVVVHNVVVPFGAKRLARAAAMADKFTQDFIDRAREGLMTRRYENLLLYRPFIPSKP